MNKECCNLFFQYFKLFCCPKVTATAFLITGCLSKSIAKLFIKPSNLLCCISSGVRPGCWLVPRLIPLTLSHTFLGQAPST